MRLAFMEEQENHRARIMALRPLFLQWQRICWTLQTPLHAGSSTDSSGPTLGRPDVTMAE